VYLNPIRLISEMYTVSETAAGGRFSDLPLHQALGVLPIPSLKWRLHWLCRKREQSVQGIEILAE